MRDPGPEVSRTGCSSKTGRPGAWSLSAWLYGLLLLLQAACASPAGRQPAIEPPLTVTAGTTLAEPKGDPELELEQLARYQTTPALLRRAFLALRSGQPQLALEYTAAVLYGPTRPAANEESFARYLRAAAYEAQGRSDMGRFDLERARELAVDPVLRQRLPLPSDRPTESASLADNRIHQRTVWNAQRPNPRQLHPMQRITRLTIHHSAVYFRDTRIATSAAQIQRIQRDHMQQSGWADIGYHFLIDPAGRIWEGRELRYQGAHAEGDNNIGNIGICLLGNFMRGRNGQQPTEAQVAAMRQLVTQLMQRYGFGSNAIFCHRDFKATDCPGPLLQPLVQQLARELGRSPRAAAGQF